MSEIENKNVSSIDEEFANMAIKDFINTQFATISENSNVKTAISIIVNKKLLGIPVIDANDKLIGIVSEKDLLLLAASGNINRIIQFCKTPEYIKPNTTFKEALIKTIKSNRKWLPVVDDNIKVVGIITRSDLLKVFLDRNDKN